MLHLGLTLEVGVEVMGRGVLLANKEKERGWGGGAVVYWGRGKKG